MSKCATCERPITGRSLVVSDKTYHPECFVCDVCKKPITESTFHETDAGKPICSKDFEANCPVCAGCGQIIKSGKTINALGKPWHEEHFVCKLCRLPLSGDFHVQDGAPVCQNCYTQKVAQKCKGCGLPIDAKSTIALDASWHPECFKCKMCGTPIVSKFKVSPEGFPICEKC